VYVGAGGDHTETISANLGGGDTTWGGSAWASVGAALVATLWPYDGFANANYIVEELRRPQRLPHIIVTAVGGVTLIYLAINIGYLAVLPEHVVRTSESIAIDFVDTATGVSWPSKVMAFLVAASAAGACNASALSGARVSYVLCPRPARLCVT